jgi:Cell wall-active antibiotics response 4TMS YvqF
LASLTRDLPESRAASASPAVVSERHRAFCSHLVRSGPWSLPSRSSWRSIFGTIDLDLRQARLAGPETVLEVYNLFGTVTVIFPDGVEVVVCGGGLFASQKIESPERPPIAGGPRLTIDARGPGGTLVCPHPPEAPDGEAVDQDGQAVDQEGAQITESRSRFATAERIRAFPRHIHG